MKPLLACCCTAAVLALGWLRLHRLRLSSGPQRLSWSNLVFGHRGCRNVRGIPENTLAAFQYAIDHGCSGIECDVRLTKDGEVVVFHDNYADGQLEGISGRKRIDELTLQELRSCRYVEDPTKEIRVPTLEEVVLFCLARHTKILIEVKDLRNIRECVDKILTLYRRYPEYMYEQTTIISFNPKVLYCIRQQDAKVATGSIYERDFIQDCIHSEADAIPLFLQALPAFFDHILFFFQEWMAPWLLGCSLMCPHYSLYNEAQHRHLNLQGIGMYFWGFKDNIACTPEFKRPGVFVSADDKHEAFQ